MPSTLTFVGCGSAFNTQDLQNNILVTSMSNKKMLIDCGSFIQFGLEPLGIDSGNLLNNIDAIYISHAHADHIGGLEWVAFTSYFTLLGTARHLKATTQPDLDIDQYVKDHRIKLFIVEDMVDSLWNNSLSGGLKSIQGKVCSFSTYFDIHPVAKNKAFCWKEFEFQPIQTIHVRDAYAIVPSYGLLIKTGKNKHTTFITTDTQYSPEDLPDFYRIADQIFHDCEVAKFESGVHAPYSKLKNLPEEYKAKMWLCHYQIGAREAVNPVEDGFRGFVTKGQSFPL